MGKLVLKRAYAPPAQGDGQRILIDRLWPRGLSRSAAAIDAWVKDIAPSTELRKWFGHDPARFAEFRDRYRRELDASPELVAQLCAAVREGLRAGNVTLVHAAHDEHGNNATVLSDYLIARGCLDEQGG